MDDRSITDDRLIQALHNLRQTNRWLGGYAASDTYLNPLLRERSRLHVLDLGAGLGDYAAHLVRRGHRWSCRVLVDTIDNNPVTVSYARRWLDTHLPARLRSNVSVHQADATSLDSSEFTSDVTHASLFLHHFYDETLLGLVRGMREAARMGIVINDLHRHPLAYASIWALSRLLRVSPMYRNDASLSVRRAFQRHELRSLAARAGCYDATIQWHWAFRWVLSTLPSPSGHPSSPS